MTVLYHCFKVKGVAIFSDNSLEAITTSCCCFLPFRFVYNTIAIFIQLPAVLLLTNKMQISLLVQLSCAKIRNPHLIVNSRAIWDIIAQLVHNLTIISLSFSCVHSQYESLDIYFTICLMIAGAFVAAL